MSNNPPRSQRRTRARQSPVERLEHRVLLAATAIRSYDGSGNNLANPTWGEAGATFLRLALAEYADGASVAAGAARPSARAISNAVAAHPADEEMLNERDLSAFAYVWGQFIDHDLDLTNTDAAAGSFPIAVPTGDPYFDPLGTGTKTIGLTRSQFETVDGVRQQVNAITAYIDGSMIYGSDEATAKSLRSLVGGRLKTSGDDLLPLDADHFSFLAGDVRVNENIELIGIHTLFLREHNRLAGQAAAANPSWTDEQIFQQARRLVIGELQAITYNEFLPALMGGNALSRYTGYKPTVNAGISNEFSTAAYRLGHSMLADDVEFISNDGEEAAEELALKDAFFNPDVVREEGIDTMLKYLASSNAEEIDPVIVDGVRNFLFGPPGAGGFDLASLNIQRGRDHGLADYNATRAALGLPRVTSFSQITSDADLAAQLKAVYGSVDEVDLWVGGLAENHVRGSSLGPTFQRIVADQFTRLRDGDRFWYERDLNAAERSLVRGTSLGEIVSMNTEIDNLQGNVFVFDVQISGRIWNDANANRRQDRGESGVSGVTLNLMDEDGEVIDTVMSGRDGGYRFDAVQIGDFIVTPVAGTGRRFTTPATATIDVTRGRQFGNVNFGVTGTRTTNPTTRPSPEGPRRLSEVASTISASELTQEGDTEQFLA